MDTKASLRRALDAAAGQLADDAAAAERLAKAISTVVKAERDLAEFLATPRPPSPDENEEDLRAELRRRVARFVDAANAGAPPEVLERIGTGRATS